MARFSIVMAASDHVGDEIKPLLTLCATTTKLLPRQSTVHLWPPLPVNAWWTLVAWNTSPNGIISEPLTWFKIASAALYATKYILHCGFVTVSLLESNQQNAIIAFDEQTQDDAMKGNDAARILARAFPNVWAAIARKCERLLDRHIHCR